MHRLTLLIFLGQFWYWSIWHNRMERRRSWDSHDDDYEQRQILRCDVVWVLQEPTFRRIISPPSSFSYWRLVLTLFLTRWFFSPWWWRRYFHKNVVFYKSHTTSHFRRRNSWRWEKSRTSVNHMFTLIFFLSCFVLCNTVYGSILTY
jgi:hypothetical protein